MKLKNQTILITGGTSGIGQALCEQLLQSGNRVIVASRRIDPEQNLLHSSPDGLTAVHCDLSSLESVRRLCQQLSAASLNPSVLINNAAVQYTPRYTDPDFDVNTIQTEITVNLSSVAVLSALLLPLLMSQPKALLLNLSSGLAIYPKTSSAIYCATKAAIHSLSQSLRYQLESTSVEVCEAILPLVDTPMTQGRPGTKLPVTQVAQQIIKGVEQGKAEIYIGKARFLPLLSRLSPRIAKKILKAY